MTLHAGRYESLRVIASGGMATVYLGRALGAGGFERLVALKMMHPHIAAEPEFVAMFLDEARLAARVRHPNVVATFDLVEDPLCLVMEYIEGPSLHLLLRTCARARRPVPLGIALRIFLDVLAGLHAAHELTGADGELLHLVHRDVSPQNVLVGIDGVTRITDFGVARAETRIMSTQGNALKGKLSYMAPEQIRGQPVDRRSDVYSAGVVLWEMLTEERLFKADNDGALIAQILEGAPTGPRGVVPTIPAAIDEICLRALCTDPAGRFPTASAFAEALEEAAASAPGLAVSSFRAVEALIKEVGLRGSPESPAGPISARGAPSSNAAPRSARAPLSQRSPRSDSSPLHQRAPLSDRLPRSDRSPLSQRALLGPRAAAHEPALLEQRGAGVDPDASGAEGSAPGLGAVVSEAVSRRHHIVRRSVIATGVAVALALGAGGFFVLGQREHAARAASAIDTALPGAALPSTVAESNAPDPAAAPEAPHGLAQRTTSVLEPTPGPAPVSSAQDTAAGGSLAAPVPVRAAPASAAPGPVPLRSAQGAAPAATPAAAANRATGAAPRPGSRATSPAPLKPKASRPEARTASGAAATAAKPAVRSSTTARGVTPKPSEPKRTLPRATSRTPFKPSGL